MKGFFGLFDSSGDNKNKDENVKTRDQEEKKIKLRKEEIDVAKSKVDIGKVEFGKEIIEEQQVVNVPVTREEVVVERRSVNEPSDQPIGEGDDEHFTLDVNEEKVEVGKHTVVTGEISAHKREIEENREIKETVRHEEARINKDGDANIIEENDQLH